ncbi:PDZ domain-containing protein [bacterium]|nr:PDZ domain-containing protein [bacterium]
MVRARLTMITLVFSLFVLLTPVQIHGSEESDDNTGKAGLQKVQSQVDLYNALRTNIARFTSIYKELNENYVDPINPEAFLKAGIEGMLGTLDPYTEYFERKDTENLEIMTRGKYGGIGIQIGLRGPERELTIISPMVDTPAWKAGLQPGDRITQIDGESTEGFTTDDAADLMRGIPGTMVKITVERRGMKEPIEYTLERAEIKVNDISYAGLITDDIGYVRLARFSRTAGQNVRTEIERLVEQGAEKLIFDLRGNPGGLLPEAIEVAESFLRTDDLIVSTKGRIPSSNREFFAREEPSWPVDKPLVVLVDQGSASASEIVAGAIQDHDRGVIVGMTTFGKGLVQSVINFKDRTALKLTTAKYYTPSGRLIQKTDYFEDNEALLGELNEDGELEDTLYFTDKGREVTAHGGIVPDIEVEQPLIGDAALELWRQGKYYEYVAQYMDEHPEHDTYDISDPMFEGFITWLEEIEFEFETEIEEQIAQIREKAEEKELNEAFMKELADLESIASAQKEAMLKAEEDQIRRRLRVELAVIIGGTPERVKASLDDDEQVRKAVDILNSIEDYTATLTAAGELDTAND